MCVSCEFMKTFRENISRNDNISQWHSFNLSSTCFDCIKFSLNDTSIYTIKNTTYDNQMILYIRLWLVACVCTCAAQTHTCLTPFIHIYANIPHTCMHANSSNAYRIDFYLMFHRRLSSPNCERAESLLQCRCCRWWIQMGWTKSVRTAVQHQYAIDSVVPAACVAVAVSNRRLLLQLWLLFALLLLHLRCWWSTTTKTKSMMVMRLMLAQSPRETPMSSVSLLLLLWRRCFQSQSQQRRLTSRHPSLWLRCAWIAPGCYRFAFQWTSSLSSLLSSMRRAVTVVVSHE